MSGVLVLSRRLLTTFAISTLAFGALAGCASKTNSTSGAAQPQQNQLAQLVADVTGSLQKVASSTDKVTSVDFSMTGTSEGTKISGDGAMAFQPLTAEINVDGGSEGATTLRVVDNVIYVKVPDAQQAQMRGKSWLKLTPGKDSPFGAAAGRQMQDVNPIEQVKTLLASGKATAVGQETVNGVPTVHYKAVTPVDTALKEVDPQYRTMVKGVYDKAGVKEITTEAWIDAQYRPRRVHVVAGTLSDLTVDYRDFNKPVTVTAPAAKDTLDIADLLKGLGG
jgi:hypothetical protein